MNLLYPLGLLGLIGIPVLILIYILKNKYTEQVISSTYIWTLSEKFLKQRTPINKLVGIISLILQILVVLFVSVAVAHPVFTVPNAANEYCFVLDGSGSMNVNEGLQTRLEKGKGEIASIINGSLNGCSYTLIYVGTTTETVYYKMENKEQALKLLKDIEPAYLTGEYTDALSIAQNFFNESPWVKTYLITDKVVRSYENVEVKNVGSHVDNYAISDVEYALTDAKIKVTGNLMSYENEAVVTVGLYIDGDSRAAATTRVVVPVYQKTPFEINADYTEFSNIKVAITNRDALALDNEVIIYSPEAETQYKALIVSDAPYFLQSALATKNNTETTVVSLKDYKSSVSGYDLYIFDGVTGAVMPRDGAVWFIDPKDSVSGSGFTFQGNVSLAEGQKLTYSSSSASALDLLRRNLLKNDIYVKEYTKCGLYRKFSTLLTHDGNPLLFAGTNSYGSRELVVAFDLHKSNLPVTADYTTLIGNMFSYTFPNAFEKTSYVCGETVRLNVPAKCNSIRVDSPMENVSYLGTGGDECELYLSEAGLYTVTMLAGGSERKFYIFAELPENERIPVVAEEAFSVRGEPSEAGKSGTYEDLLAWFILLAVLAAADWGVYCYEQYQLR